MRTLSRKFILLFVMVPLFARAQSPRDPHVHNCSTSFALISGLSTASGLFLEGVGATSMAAPFVINTRYGKELAHFFDLPRGLMGGPEAYANWQARLSHELKWPLLTAGVVTSYLGYQLAKGMTFKLYLYQALREAEDNRFGNATRGLSILLNHTIYSAAGNPSRIISAPIETSRQWREEMAGTLGTKKMSARDLHDTLKAMIAEGVGCTMQSPLNWIEYVVWTYTRNQPVVQY